MPERPQRRVLVVEDEPLIRTLVVSLLNHAGFACCEAGDAAAALKLLRAADPDAIVVDLHLGDGPGGVEVLTAAERIAPWVAMVVLTNAPSALAAGVDPRLIPQRAAYLNKHSLADSQLLLDALEGVLVDQAPRRDDQDGDDPFAGLSADQLSVLRMVAEGLSNAEIAARRGTTPHAVEQVFRRVLTRLGVPRDAAINPRVLAARLYYARATHPT